jgi:hypothetical protein
VLTCRSVRATGGSIINTASFVAKMGAATPQVRSGLRAAVRRAHVPDRLSFVAWQLAGAGTPR